MRNKYVRIALAAMLVTAVASAQSLSEFHRHFADSVGTAHGIEAYRAQPALQADITVTLGGDVMLKGVLTFDTPVGQSRIETEQGTVMVFDGQHVWVAPQDAPLPAGMARFHLLTWPNFIAAPFKLADPGTHLTDAGNKPLDAHRILPAGKLTFEHGDEDAPDDGYLLYRDPDTDRLAAMARLMPPDQTAQEADHQPHLVIYEAYETLDGVTLPTRLGFWNWEPTMGKTGELQGSIELSHYQFIEPGETTFTKPDGARIDAMPPSDNEG